MKASSVVLLYTALLAPFYGFSMHKNNGQFKETLNSIEQAWKHYNAQIKVELPPHIYEKLQQQYGTDRSVTFDKKTTRKLRHAYYNQPLTHNTLNKDEEEHLFSLICKKYGVSTTQELERKLQKFCLDHSISNLFEPINHSIFFKYDVKNNRIDVVNTAHNDSFFTQNYSTDDTINVVITACID